ncbi:MAG TPA: hypothetical protein DCR97_11245 [Deltaproteobacteria bacterium]|jgi:hypothetical protein|nr:hypothetical protein [Deltaproteobacteria bacterium]
MKEKRQFFRIKDHLEIEFREIDKEEFAELEHEIKYRPSQVFEANSIKLPYEDDRTGADDKETLIPYLRIIDRKLSAILDLLSRTSHDLRMGQAKLFTAWYGEIEISGAGLSLVMPTPFAAGTLLHLKVMLPIFPYPTIHTLCEALRHQETSANDMTGWKNALKFRTINDLDRDLLVSYIFDKEREQIRLRKALDHG